MSKPGSWYPRIRSIAPALLDHNIGSRQNTMPKNFLATSREIRIVHRLVFLYFRNDMRDQPISLPKFYALSRTQPSLQASRVAEFTDVNGWHITVVTHLCVTLKGRQSALLSSTRSSGLVLSRQWPLPKTTPTWTAAASA